MNQHTTNMQPYQPYLADEAAVRALVAWDRLCPVLVRYRGATEGRFSAPAQDVLDLVAMLDATGRYVRDMQPMRAPLGGARQVARLEGRAS